MQLFLLTHFSRYDGQQHPRHTSNIQSSEASKCNSTYDAQQSLTGRSLDVIDPQAGHFVTIRAARTARKKRQAASKHVCLPCLSLCVITDLHTCRSLVNTLPDKGAKLRTSNAQIDAQLERATSPMVTDTPPKDSAKKQPSLEEVANAMSRMHVDTRDESSRENPLSKAPVR